MEINEFAKKYNLARKFENAIEAIDRGKGWVVFDGLETGTVTVKVIYDGGVRFEAIKKPKKKKVKKTPVKKAEPKPELDPELDGPEDTFTEEELHLSRDGTE